MNKEEIKQYLRNQIDSCIKIQSKQDKSEFYLCYNKSYLRALKLSKITGQPVNQNDFKGGEYLFGFDSETNIKDWWHYNTIRDYLEEHYSKVYCDIIRIIEEVFNEYEEYKGYKYWVNYD